MYGQLSDKLATTNCRLRVDLQAYLALKLTQKVKGPPSTCTICHFDGTLNINDFLTKGQLQGCHCNGAIRWSTEAGRQRLDHIVSQSRFDWVDWPSRHCGIESATSRMHLVCNICLGPTCPTVAQFVNGSTGCARTSQCRIPRPQEWKHEASKQRLDELVANSRFEWKHFDSRHDCIQGEDSRIELVCTVCGVTTTPTIGHFAGVMPVGCGCKNQTELSVLTFLNEVVAKYDDVKVIHQYTDPVVVGMGNGVLKFDMAVCELDTPILFIEIDGGHHFDREYSYGGNSSSKPNRAFEHDIIKEKHTIARSAAMARMEVVTVSTDKCNWKAWLKRLVCAAVDHSLSSGICRLSAGRHYINGPYVEMRKGSAIDIDREAVVLS